MTSRQLTTLLVAASVTSILMGLLIGPTNLGVARTLAVLTGSGTSTDTLILLEIRLPRALAAWMVGALLGLSGAALQGLLRNPLAEPGVLGVSATASLFATVAIYYGLTSLNAFLLPVAAIAGAMTATALLAVVAIRLSSVVTLILVGVGLSSLAGALMSLLLNLAPTPFTLSDMVNWTLGSVANRGINDLLLAAPFMILGGIALVLSAPGLTAMTLGDDVASTLGVELPKVRNRVVLGAGLCTGAAVSIAGAVGFVGIIAPHLVRRFVHYDPARTMLPAALLAGTILVLADLLIRLIPTTTELRLGVVAALIGAPVFIYIAVTRMRGTSDE